MGFKDSYKIWRSNISTNWENQPNADVRIEPLALDSIKEYLKQKNNEARFQIVALLDDLPDTFNIMARADGKVSGFVMTRPGRLKPFIGPLFADSDEIATCLLNKALMYWDTQGFTHVFIDVPEYHIGQASVFMNEDDPPVSTKRSQFSIQQIRSFVRMYQLISELELEKYLQESMNIASKSGLHLAVEGYKKTKKYVEKERNEIIPSMFATGGPEMS